VEASTAQPRREAGKALRRRRIIEAAGALAREVGFDAVSMAQIAKRAQVSPATPYNLFQTKHAIFREVYSQDLARLTQKLDSAHAARPLERVFLAIDFANSHYRRNPKYYRARAHFMSMQAVNAVTGELGREFWRARVADAIAAGELRAEADANLLGGLLLRIIQGLTFEWVAGSVTLDRLGDEAAYGFALLLHNYVTEEAEALIVSRIKKLERALARTQKKSARRGGRGRDREGAA